MNYQWFKVQSLRLVAIPNLVLNELIKFNLLLIHFEHGIGHMRLGPQVLNFKLHVLPFFS